MFYKDLLKKYINHVEESEGVDFIRWGSIDNAEGFTREEKKELIRISNELDKENQD